MSESYENARILVQQYGLWVFPSGAAWGQRFIDLATNDLEALEAFNHIDANADYRVRAGGDFGVYVVDTPAARDYQALTVEWGPHERTWMVSRATGATQRWFRASPHDPDFILGARLLDSRAFLKLSGPVPGSKHPKYHERYSWRAGHAPADVSLAPLPVKWRNGMAVAGEGVTNAIVQRHEWNGATAGRNEW